MLARYADTASKITEAYSRYDYQTIFHTLNTFLTVDVSAFYIDISKDLLYTYSNNHPERRSTQTAIYHIADGIARLIAPILPVTADDYWCVLPGERSSSVHLADFQENVGQWHDQQLIERWNRLIKMREVANAEIEKLRKQKVVGTSLEALVHVTAGGETLALLEQYREVLDTLFIAQVRLESDAFQLAKFLVKRSNCGSNEPKEHAVNVVVATCQTSQSQPK